MLQAEPFCSPVPQQWTSGSKCTYLPTNLCDPLSEPEDTKIFQTVTPPTGVDDSQLMTLRLDSGNHIRFQVDTGAECNVVPLSVYKKATKDTGLT